MKTEVERFELAVKQTEKLFEYCKSNLKENIDKYYVRHYFTYFKKTNVNQMYIEIKVKISKYARFTICSYFDSAKKDKEYFLSIWKWSNEIGGTEEKYDLNESEIQEDNFDSLIKLIKNFYELDKKPDVEYINLFDFI